MKKIYIFGVGRGKGIVLRCLCRENVHILGYVDNAADRYPEGVDGFPVRHIKNLVNDYDMIVISVMQYEPIKMQLLDAGVDIKEVICFFCLEDARKSEYWEILDSYQWRLEALAYQYMQHAHYYLDNLKYEVADAIQKGEIQIPHILPSEYAVERICSDRVSLVRFGDGEFSILSKGISRLEYQKKDCDLSDRLREILCSDAPNILVAIANNYGSLERYTESTANEIRKYMTSSVRQEHMALLDMDKEYYDAFLSRPYLMYKDRQCAGVRFEDVKRIWKDRDVVLIEGEMTRMGVGNDLLDGAASVQRILAPTEQAFDRYEEIFEAAKKQGEQKLFLLVLGPTATVLAYDLACCGYQAVDIGQIDLEYEWYLRGTNERCAIPYKYVHRINSIEEVSRNELPEADRKKYMGQIVSRIE